MALLSKKRLNLNLQERDFDALVGTYHAGIISAGHLVRLYWPGKNPYGYLRLRMLAENGYLGTEGFHEALPQNKNKKRKLSSFYYLTGQGIDAIEGKIEGKVRPPWKNKPGEKKYYEHYHMGEIWCRLAEDKLICPKQWISSRLAKEKFQIGHHVPLHSIVEVNGLKGQKIYAFYYLARGATKKHVNLIKNFIPRVDVAGINKHFIICFDYDVLGKVLNLFTQRFPKKNIHVLAFSHAKEVLSMYLLDNKIFYRELIKRICLNLGKKVDIEKCGPLDAGPYFFEFEGRKNIITELISGKIDAFARLQLKGHCVKPEKLFVYVFNDEYIKVVKSFLSSDIEQVKAVFRDNEIGKDMIILN